MALEDEDLATKRGKSFGDGKSVGTSFDDQHVVLSRVASDPGAERREGLPCHAVDDAGLEWIAPIKNGSGESIRMDVQADHPAASAERWWRIEALH
jgi:hypothetical protein